MISSLLSYEGKEIKNNFWGGRGRIKKSRNYVHPICVCYWLKNYYSELHVFLLQCDTCVVIDSGIITVWYLCYYYSVIPVLLLTLEPLIRLYGLCWEVELTQQGKRIFNGKPNIFFIIVSVHKLVCYLWPIYSIGVVEWNVSD